MKHIDNLNTTEDPRRIVFDIINFSKTETMIFWDFDAGRELARKEDPAAPIPPREIIVPPLHMAAIPDDYYKGKTKSGRQNPEVIRMLGVSRPLRQVGMAGIGSKRMGFVLKAGNWTPVPINARGWAAVREVTGRSM